ncbi:MAG: XrtA system polysaccharide deacetylase [Pseudomonadota bacterium]
MTEPGQVAITNAFTVDVEDYFQVSAFAPYIPRDEWNRRECRVEANIDRILGLLDERGVQGTFFTLGWIAERYPSMTRRIVDQGHELASHGYGHERASDMTPEAFLADIRLAKLILEDLAGQAVRGYRAPSFSIGLSNPWAYDMLEEAGYQYSSSIFPIKHDHYGVPDAPRFLHRVGNLVEIPATTVRMGGRNFPSSGGGYFRLLPYPLSRVLFRRVNHVDRHPVVFYFHPWEIDTGQPRIPGVNFKTRFRHYVNIPRMESRLRQLLKDFRWHRLDVVHGLNPDARPA